MPLLPGDMYLIKDIAAQSVFARWKTFTVIAIDYGEMPSKPGGTDGRPASIMLLVDGPQIVHKPFDFLRNYIKVAGDGKVP